MLKKSHNELENVQQGTTLSGQVNNQAPTVMDIVGEAVNQPTAKELQRESLQHITSNENDEAEAETGQLFRDFYPNTELGIDLKLITRKPGRMRVNESIKCTLTYDDENHYTAVENALKRSVAESRNAHIYVGDCVNVNIRTDGIVYPTFRHGQLYSGNISFKDFSLAAAQELKMIASLLGEEDSQE